MTKEFKLMQGNVALAEGGCVRGMPVSGRIPHHAQHGNHGGSRRSPAPRRRTLHPDGRRNRLHQRHRRGQPRRCEKHDRHQRARLFADAGNDRVCLHDRNTHRHRQRDARRSFHGSADQPGPGRHPPGPLGHPRRSPHCRTLSGQRGGDVPSGGEGVQPFRATA